MSHRSPHEASAAIRAALSRGDKLQAIKLLREASRLGLKEAKDQIEQMAKEGKATIDRGGFDAAEHVPLDVPRSLPPAAMNALQQGRKVEAIQLTREHYGLGLKEAKDLVEAQQVTVVGDSNVPPYQVGSGGGWWWVVLFIAAAVVGYVLLFGDG